MTPTPKDNSGLLCNVRRHSLFNTWRGMIGRCKYETDRWYHNYGGRGITVCSEWHDSLVFATWAIENGWEEGLHIDRIDNDGNYCPENCRFVTRSENMRNCRSNRMLTYNGVTQPIVAWAEQTGVHHGTIRSRLRRGWTPEQIFTLSPQRGKKP